MERGRQSKWTLTDLERYRLPQQLSLDAALAGKQAGDAAYLRWVMDQPPDPPMPRGDHDAVMRWIRATNAQDDRCAGERARLTHDGAEHAAVKAVLIPWNVLRTLVWERDGGTCWVCGEQIPWEYYHLGHLIDRVAGGLDVPENLVVMCNVCNMRKPVHDTVAEAERWRNEGGWHAELVDRMLTDERVRDLLRQGAAAG